MTIAQASVLLKLAQADLLAGRLSGRDYLIKRQQLQDDLVALVHKAGVALCQHGSAISCARCPLSTERRCLGRRGFSFGVT